MSKPDKHDMKDRFRLSEWPPEWISKVLEDFPKFNRETRVFLAKVLRLMMEGNHQLSGVNLRSTALVFSEGDEQAGAVEKTP